MVRKLFLIAAATFLFALAFHLAAVNAGAQAPGVRVVGDGIIATDVAIYRAAANGWQLVPSPAPIPQIASMSADGNSAVTIDGTGWGRDGAGTAWRNLGPAPGVTPISVQRATWSEAKARYR